MYHEYDLNLAKEDLAIYRPSETGIDSWDADDRIIFETAYRLHAKSFLKIQGIVLIIKCISVTHIRDPRSWMYRGFGPSVRYIPVHVYYIYSTRGYEL